MLVNAFGLQLVRSFCAFANQRFSDYWKWYAKFHFLDMQNYMHIFGENQVFVCCSAGNWWLTSFKHIMIDAWNDWCLAKLIANMHTHISNDSHSSIQHLQMKQIIFPPVDWNVKFNAWVCIRLAFRTFGKQIFLNDWEWYTFWWENNFISDFFFFAIDCYFWVIMFYFSLREEIGHTNDSLRNTPLTNVSEEKRTYFYKDSHVILVSF